MNVKLLKQIAKEIKEEPRRLEMHAWFQSRVGGFYAPPCGTTACIAGFALTLSESVKLPFAERAKAAEELSLNYEADARKLLGLTGKQATRLFYMGDWPERYREKYDGSHDPKERAAAAVARINHFIKTKGRE